MGVWGLEIMGPHWFVFLPEIVWQGERGDTPIYLLGSSRRLRSWVKLMVSEVFQLIKKLMVSAHHGGGEGWSFDGVHDDWRLGRVPSHCGRPGSEALVQEPGIDTKSKVQP